MADFVKIQKRRDPGPDEKACPKCSGTGRVDNHVCTKCHGSGVVPKNGDGNGDQEG